MPHLAHALDDLQHAFGMRFGKLSARRVARQSAAETQRAACNECAALALLAEAVVFKLRQNHVGEAIVDLRGVDILWAEARHAIGCLATLTCGGVDHIVVGKPAARVVERAEALDEHWGLAQICRTLAASDDNCTGSVGPQTAIVDAEWCNDHATGVIIVYSSEIFSSEHRDCAGRARERR